jgi:hypothetical protein
MSARQSGLPGVSEYPGRLRRASRKLILARNTDNGIGRMLGTESSVTDTAALIDIAAFAAEPWREMKASIEFLRDRLDEIATGGAPVPTDAISSGLRGVTVYAQSWSANGLGLVVEDIVDLLDLATIQGGWGETTRAVEMSITQTARMLRALRGVAHMIRLSRDHGHQFVSDDTARKVGALAAMAIQTLLDHREPNSGWRLHADSLGPLSYATTGECVLALIDGSEMLTDEERLSRRFHTGRANVDEPETLTLAVVINQSAWWLHRTQSSWVDLVEVDQRSAQEPWTRLSYAVALEAAASESSSPSSLRNGAAKLSSLWLEEFELWGEVGGGFDPAPTVRGTYAVVHAMESIRAALGRRALGVVEIPLDFEPDPAAEATGRLLFGPENRITLVYGNADRFEFSVPADQLKLLRVIADAGSFGVSRQDLAVHSNVPVQFIWTYLKRLNDRARAETLYTRPPLVHRISQSASVWRLHPSLTYETADSAADERTA